MFRMYASNSHSNTYLILALGIVREPTVWGCITSKYPGIHDIGRATIFTSFVKGLLQPRHALVLPVFLERAALARCRAVPGLRARIRVGILRVLLCGDAATAAKENRGPVRAWGPHATTLEPRYAWLGAGAYPSLTRSISHALFVRRLYDRVFQCGFESPCVGAGHTAS